MTDTEAGAIYDRINGLASEIGGKLDTLTRDVGEYHAQTVAIVTGCKICQQKLLQLDRVVIGNGQDGLKDDMAMLKAAWRTTKLFIGWGLVALIPLVAVVLGVWLEHGR